MNDHAKSWIQSNLDTVINFVVDGNYNGLLCFCHGTGCEMSVMELSHDLNCSRRAVRRYLHNERKLPFEFAIRLLKLIEIDQDLLFS